jgi:hypothetical protein
MNNDRVAPLLIMSLALLTADPLLASDSGHSGGGADSNAIRVKLKDAAQGEFICKDGELMKGRIVYGTFRHSLYDAYAIEAVENGILPKDKAASVAKETRTLAARIAFLQKAEETLRSALDHGFRDALSAARVKGAQEMIKTQLRKAITECRSDQSGDLNCPPNDTAAPAGGSSAGAESADDAAAAGGVGMAQRP